MYVVIATVGCLLRHVAFGSGEDTPDRHSHFREPRLRLTKHRPLSAKLGDIFTTNQQPTDLLIFSDFVGQEVEERPKQAAGPQACFVFTSPPLVSARRISLLRRPSID